MVIEIGNLHDPRQAACGPWRIHDASYVCVVGLTGSVREKLQGSQFDVREAVPAKFSALGWTQLEQVMEPCRGASVRGDCRRDARHMLDDWLTKAVALAHMSTTSQSVRNCRLAIATS
jgi:hypothetical protein